MSGIDEFWAWWPSARPRIEQAIESNAYGSITEEIGERVSAIHPDLDWELGPGIQGARHLFCLSGKADPALRRVTERWLRAGPPADETWEFHPARVGGREALEYGLELEGQSFRFSELVCSFEVDEPRERIDVRLFHPSFVDMPEATQQTAAFLALDALLGEDEVERWLGGIEVAPIDAASPIEDLLTAVDSLAESANGRQLTLLRAERDGAPLFVVANLSLKRIDHLLHDMHAEVRLELEEPTANGLPTTADLAALDAIEDELQRELGDAALYAGRETGGGVRTLHFYAPELNVAPQVIEAWAHRLDREVRIEWRHDPQWELLRRFG